MASTDNTDAQAGSGTDAADTLDVPAAGKPGGDAVTGGVVAGVASGGSAASTSAVREAWYRTKLAQPMKFAFQMVLPVHIRDNAAETLGSVIPRQIVMPNGSVGIGAVPDGDASFSLRNSAGSSNDFGIGEGPMMIFSAPATGEAVLQRQRPIHCVFLAVLAATHILATYLAVEHFVVGSDLSFRPAPALNLLLYALRCGAVAVGVLGVLRNRARALAAFIVYLLLDVIVGFAALVSPLHAGMLLLELYLASVTSQYRETMLSHWFVTLPSQSSQAVAADAMLNDAM